MPLAFAFSVKPSLTTVQNAEVCDATGDQQTYYSWLNTNLAQ